MAQTAFAFDSTPTLPALAGTSPRSTWARNRPSAQRTGGLPAPMAPMAPIAPIAPLAPIAPAASDAALEAAPSDTGFQIGWDFARHGLVPPAGHLLPGHPVRQGWEAGHARFGQRTRAATRHARTWLHLRLHAWQRGRLFEDVQVTPNFLAQIDTPRCPITRLSLSPDSSADNGASVDRVFNDAGYAAGNLAVMSRRANRAKGSLRWDDARLLAVLAESRQDGQAQGLSSPQWARLATLMSFVTPLPHELAATLPLLVLPPNRLRLLNPVQGLQALITLQLTRPGYAARIARLVSCLPGATLRRDFHLFFHSLLPRAWDGGRPADDIELRERLEDAWRNPLVLRRWQRFATQLTLEQTEALLQRAVALGLAGLGVQAHAAGQATEGWGLGSAGFDPVQGATAPRPDQPQAGRAAEHAAGPAAGREARPLQALTEPGFPGATGHCHT